LLEDFDAAIIDFLMQNATALLFGVGLGNIHLFADSFLLPDVAAFASGTSFVAKMGVLRVISETGLIGALLMLVFVIRLWLICSSTIGRSLILTSALAYFLVGHASLFYIAAGATIGTIGLHSTIHRRHAYNEWLVR
jgi:hypothetical protein